MRFCLLSIDDAEALLAFEIENRQWFEASIEKREKNFYNLESVKAQISNFLDLYKEKQMFPALVKDDQGKILARANLRLANQGHDTFGYRVAKAASGKGVATFATKHILKLAQEEFALSKISAFVSIENPASVRVLHKFGFEEMSLQPGMALVEGRNIDCYLYQLFFD